MTSPRFAPLRMQILPNSAPTAFVNTSGKDSILAEAAPTRVATGKRRRQGRATAKENSKARKIAEEKAESAHFHLERLRGLVASTRAHVADKHCKLVLADLKITELQVAVDSLSTANKRLVEDRDAVTCQLEEERRRHASAEKALGARYADLVNTTQSSHLELVHHTTNDSSKLAQDLRRKLAAAQDLQERTRQERDEARAALGRGAGPVEKRLRTERDSARREVASLRLELSVAKQGLLARDLEIRDSRERARSVFPGRE